MADLQKQFQDPEDLEIKNGNQQVGKTASTLSDAGRIQHTELDDDDDSGDYFGGAIEELGTSGNLLHKDDLMNENEDDELNGPFDDPLLREDMIDIDALEGTHDDVLETSSNILDVDHIHTKTLELGKDLSNLKSNSLDGGGGSGEMSNANGLGLLQGVTKTGHRHDLHDRVNPAQPGHSLVGGLIWALVFVHVLLLVVIFVAWWRQRRSKDPTMRRSLTPGPPQKVGCSYDMDKSFSMPKLELGNLPIKALKTLKQAKA